MNWDWQVFCEDTIERKAVQGCFGKNGDITYLDWMLSAWGWTVSVSLLSLLIALIIGSAIGTLRTLEDRLSYLRNLDQRRQEVKNAIDGQGKLTDELSAAIDSAATLAEVEDLYRPYKQKRRTRATVAREKGLEPLAQLLLAQGRIGGHGQAHPVRVVQ